MAQEQAGWSGRLLLVDLTYGTFDSLDTMRWAPDFIGGRVLAAALAWEMLGPDVGPLDPASPLMFLAGPLAGTLAPAAGRTTVCALAPQSSPKQWFSRASMGGDLGHQMKAAGYDGIVCVGQAPHPAYLFLGDDGPHLLEAEDLWGRGIMDTQAAIRARHGARCQAACIGPAGERLSRIASIGINEGSAAGQCGFGAVMGAKRLKAVAALGSGRPRIAHPEALRGLIRAIALEQTADREERRRSAPSSGRPAGRPAPCSRGCISTCATHYEGIQGTVHAERTYSGVVQCTAYRFGGSAGALWNLGFPAGFELNMLANDWGINHWDLVKGLFPWISMSHAAGMLPDLAGRPLETNDPRFWYEVLEAIAFGQGPMAEVVGDGGWQAIQRTGILPEDARQLYTGYGYANHWDGRGPRGNTITYPFWLASALMWMADSRDPMGSAHDYVQNMTNVSPFGQGLLSWEQLEALGARLYGRPKAMDPLSDGEGKAEAALFSMRRAMLKDSLPLCDRVFPRLFTTQTDDGLVRVDGIEGPDLEAHLLRLTTGLDFTPADLDAMADRALALERLQQVRDQGRTREDERAVQRFFCETPEEYPNPLLGAVRRADPAALEALAREFYNLRGWDPDTGVPTDSTLERLGLGTLARGAAVADGQGQPGATPPGERGSR